MDGRRDITVRRDKKTVSLSVIPGEGRSGPSTRPKLALVQPTAVDAFDDLRMALREFETSTKRTILIAFGSVAALDVLFFLLDRM